MIEQGHIEIIDQKVIFVYHNLKKPKKEDYYSNTSIYGISADVFEYWNYERDFKKYEASKQSVEVENVKRKTEEVYVPVNSSAFIQTYHIGDKQIHDNQDCKAKIVNNKATIIQLLLGAIPSWKVREKWIKI